MGQYYTGTLLASPIVRGSSGDTYGTHHSVLGVGGYMEVSTLAQRDALPVDTVNGIYYDGLSSGQRRLGMLVHVFSNNIIYHLQPNVTYATWTGYTSGQKVAALADNLNWNVFLTSGGTTTASENISKNFFQATHGFTGGTVIGYNGTNYTRVNSGTANTVEPLGIVSQKIDADNFRLTYAGYINTTGFRDYSGGTLKAGTTYYLATGTSANNLTKYAPTSISAISKPMLVVLASGNTGVVLQYRGSSKNDVGVSYGVFTGYTATTNVALNKTVTGATNIGYFSGMTGIQYLDVLTPYAAYNGFYHSLYNNYYRDTNGYIQYGTSTYRGALRRGYVKTVPPVKSFLYNTYTGSTNKVGWILVDGDISSSVGTYLSGLAASGTPPFTVTGWTTGYHSTSGFSLTASGSLTTGTTYNIGGPIYNDKRYQELRMRTLMSNSAGIIKVTYDDNFVYISGATAGIITGASTASNVGTGVGIFKSKTGTTLQFRSLVGSGSTCISQHGDNIVIYSTDAGTLTGATNGITISGANVRLGGTLTGSTVFTDSRVTKFGLQYAADYSANYNSRSIPDVAYVNAIASGIRPKAAVIVATTGSTVLSGLTTIDNVLLTYGMRILVKNQVGGVTNGIYSASTGTWNRTTDFDGSPSGETVSGNYVWVLSGNTNAQSSWILTTPDPITIGVTPLTFALFNHVQDVIGGTGITITTITGTHIISVNGPILAGNSILWSASTFNVNPNSGTLSTALDNKLSKSVFSAYTGTTTNVDNYALTGGTNGIGTTSRKACLGGPLTASVSLDGNSIHDWCFNCLNLFDLTYAGTATITDINGTPTGLQYASDYSSYYVNRSIPDVEYVNKKASIVNVRCATTYPFNLVSTDNYVGVTNYGLGNCACLYLLPSPACGQKIIIADIQGCGLDYSITIDGNGKSINNNGTCATINTDYGSVTLIYNGTFWSPVAFVN